MWERFREQKIFLIIGQLLIASALLLTFSRSSYLAGIVGMLILGLFKKRIWLMGMIGLGLYGLFVILPKPGWGFVRFDRMISTLARVENWLAAWELFTQSPIIGWGFNTLRFRQFPTIDLLSKAAAGVDNSFLFVLVTSGLVGLVAFGYMLQDWLRIWMRLIDSQKFKTLGQVGISLSVAIFVHSLFINSLFYPWVIIFLASMIGVALKVFDTLSDARG